jgi:hypothetical protein
VQQPARPPQLAVIASVLVLSALVIGAVVIAVSSEDEGLKQSVQPFPRDMREQLHHIRDATAAVRGLSAKTDMTEGYITQAALRQYVEENSPGLTEEEKLELQRLAEIYVLLHMIEPGFDLETLYAQASTDYLAGFYSAEEELLVIVGKPDTGDLEDELILSHEYVHSFQDQAFGFKAFENLEEEEQSEYDLTVPCIFEGDATVASYRYMASTHGEDWLRDLAAAASDRTVIPASDQVASDSIPIALARYFAFRYLQCPIFVEAILDKGGWDGVNALYARVPVTSEQVLHSEKYLSNEGPSNLGLRDLSSAIGEDWTRVHVDRFGEFDVYNYLASFEGGMRAARDAAAGWAGGWLTLYQSVAGPEASLVHISLEWDTEAEFGEFQTEYGRALRRYGFNALALPQSLRFVWTWSGGREHGIALWSGVDRRVEIVVGNDEAAVLRGLKDAPETAAQYEVLGRWATSRQEWQAAIDAYSKSLALNPDQPLARFSRAASYGMLGDLERAIGDLTINIEQLPMDAMYRWRRAEFQQRLQNHAAAIADFSDALAIWQSQRNASATGLAYAGRANSYASLGRVTEAIADLEAALLVLTEPVRRAEVEARLAELRAR